MDNQIEKQRSDISAYFRFFFITCLTFLHIRGFYTNSYIEYLFSIPFFGNVCLTSSSNYFFFTLSGYYIGRKYGDNSFNTGWSFLSSHYLKLFKMSLLTFPLSIWFHYMYFRKDINLMNSLLDIFLLRTGYISGDVNPYNQPLWFIDILFLLYFIYYVERLFIKKEKQLFHLVVFITISAILNGVFSLPAADGRVHWALMAFYGGLVLSDIAAVQKTSKLIDALSVLFCLFLILFFGYEIVTGGGVVEVYPSGFQKIATEILLWMPLTWICSHITISNQVFANITKQIEKIATSLFIWHWPFINIIGGWIRKTGITPLQLRYVIIQLGLLIAIAYISSLWIEPFWGKLVDNCLNYIRKDQAELKV